MIRQATKHDKKQIIDLIRLIRDESEIEELQFENEEQWNRLLDTMLAGAGIIYIEDGKGLIMGLITPSIWCDKSLILHEVMWFVKKEYRKSTIGYRLFDAYVKYGKKLKDEKRIKYFVMGKLPTSPNIKYEKYGFKKTDESWIQ
jgi:N-acetylglutamate synthase-like GNAT family acetyltransferase